MTDAVMARTRELRRAGASIWPQVSPRSGFDTRVQFDSAAQFAGMPAWAELSQAEAPGKLALLADETWRARARQDWDSTTFTLFPKRALPMMRVTDVGGPALARFEGRSFSEVLEAWGGHPADVLARWLLESELKPSLVNPGTSDADFDHLGSLLADDATLVGASDAGAHALLFCGAGDTTLFLTRHVRERGDLSIEHAVHKLTGMAAGAFGIRDRGLIAPGLAGDLTIFALDELRYEPERLVSDMPGGARRFSRPPGGYRATIVGGSLTQEDGQATGAQPGVMLHSGAGAR